MLKSAIKESVSKDYDGYLMFDISNPQWDVFSRTKYDEIGPPTIQIEWAISGFAESIKKRWDTITRSTQLTAKTQCCLLAPTNVKKTVLL
ncbi:hypothetical protein NFY92_001322 [Escherichia coli]|nr:hypothetical protein [Escherichia coli]